MFKTDILFTGFYGHQNSGDDAFVEVASWGAQEIWKKKNNIFLCKSSNLPKTIVKTKGYPLSIPRTYSLQSNLLLENTKSFIYAGGSTLHGILSEKSIRFKALQKKIKANDINFGAIGVSIGPFNSIKEEKAVQSYLRKMDFLAVRDQESFNFVSSVTDLPYKPVNAFDLAALLPDLYNYEYNISNDEIQKVVGISLCNYEILNEGLDIELERKRNRMLCDLIRYLDLNENIHFKFYIINGNDKIGDLQITQDTIAKYKPKSFEVVPYNVETRCTWESIANCDFVVSTRLHAAIFACFANVPFMLNEYHRKCEDFLHNIGYYEEYRLFNSDYSIQDRGNQIIEILNNRKKYIYPKRLDQMKKLAELNFTAIKL